jgi:hypothetical protein
VKILPKIDIGAYRQVASKKKKPFHVDSKSAGQALDHKQIKSHIDVGAYGGVSDAYKNKGHKSGSSKGGDDRDISKADENYKQIMQESLDLRRDPDPRYPTHIDHKPGDIAKYGSISTSGYLQVTVATISRTYPLVPRSVSHQIPDDTQDKLIADLISVQVQNDMQNDIPTLTMILGNSHDWSSLFAVNDLIRVDYILPDKQYRQFDKCIYTGLVSNLTRNANYNGAQETYTVVGQGMAKIMSNIQLSTFSDLQSNLNGYQLLPDDEKTGIGFKQHTSANIIKQIINRFVLQNQGGVNTYDYLNGQGGRDITDRATPVKAGVVNDFMGQPKSQADYQAYLDSLPDKNGNTADGSDQNSDTDQNGKNNDSETNNQVSWLNIPMQVSENGELPIQNLIEFYIYENLDESYPDAGPSNPFLNYNGSILQFIKDVSAKPFNEMYWTHDRGLATFNYRPTPFDPQNWMGLPVNEIAPGDIMSVNIQNNDQEQASIFKLTPTQGMGIDQYDGGFTGNMAPLTNMELIHRYGYKLMNVQVDYFNGNKQEDPLSQVTAGTTNADSEAMKGWTQEEAMLHAPYYTSVVDAFYYTSGRKANGEDISIPKEAGGSAQYNAVNEAIKASGNAYDFARSVAGLGISQEDANTLWTMRNHFNRTSYLSVMMPNYTPTNTAISKNSKYLKSYDRMAKNPEKAAGELIDEMGYTIGPEQAWEIVQSALAHGGKPSEADYDRIMNSVPFDQGHDGINGSPDSGQQSVPFLFLRYTQKLFDWYADNAKFYSGTITLGSLSTPMVDWIGERVMFYDDPSGVWWEFYCEGVTTSWSYANGLQVTLNVTRGVPLRSEMDDFYRRFTEPWSFKGKFTRFLGGYFGEQNLATAISNASKDSGGDSGGTSNNDIVKFAQQVKTKGWTYSQPNRSDFGSIGSPKENGHADCSSFSWYCAKSCGYSVGDTPFTTFSCKSILDPIDSKDAKAGDMVVNDANPHMGILEEDWHGGDTKVIDMNATENIAEEPYSQGFGTDTATWWGRPKK